MAKEYKLKDPFAEREAEKYARPIPSRELILQVMKEHAVPLKLEELADLLGVDEEEDRESLRRRLNAMERDGQLLKNRRDRYCIVNQTDLIAGRVIGHADGFGFLRPDEGGEDLYLSSREMRALMHDDRALVCVRGIDRRGRREGGLVQVLERNTHRLVGRLYQERGISFVVPDNKHIAHDILIPEEHLGGAKPGQVVLTEIIEQPTRQRDPIGRISQIIGDHMAPGMEIEIAIRNFDLPAEWPEAVRAEIDGLSETIPEEAKAGRLDLRQLPLVTIDGEDAQDFDDAVYCERTAKGWKLYVAIADVSYYVRPGTALDEEAKKRGTSVYFPDRVIPMLPEILSNGLCSLKPEEDRLCMVCEMVIGMDGRILRSRFSPGVMHSHARLTYTEVARLVVEGDKGLRRKYRPLLPHLEELHALYRVLRRAREERGAMDFDTQESRIIFGEGKKIERIVPLVRNDAHRLIEECMLAANTAAARYLARRKIPHLVRIHEGPSAEKLADLRAFLGRLGLSLGGGDRPEPKDYCRLMDQIAGRADEHLIQTVLLRSMAQALYSPEKKGHFGLALDAYAHFTSPIRRYPDLLVHRALRHCLEGRPRAEYPYSNNDMVLLGEHCSFTERRADEATRDVVAWLKCEYMQDKLGEEFAGVISAVTPFGFFVELKDVYIEGLVHVSNLGKDYFHYDPVGLRLQGERTGTTYQLGDSVRVVVARVDLDERKIDLELVKEEARSARRPRKKRRRA
ncbi:ribonuclease R [Candidatus Methylocalor cossyra]|uniref:Ribonuclease R n=1 Tax=Candidatus Methylocalor cossyra TaxID=3108543 RepID=A0ABM9NHN6_9GAMM